MSGVFLSPGVEHGGQGGQGTGAGVTNAFSNGLTNIRRATKVFRYETPGSCRLCRVLLFGSVLSLVNLRQPPPVRKCTSSH